MEFERAVEMSAEKNEFSAPSRFESSTVDVAIRIGLLALLAYWSLKVIGPFLTIALWSAILTVALYPLFDWLAQQLGSRRLAATLITLLCLMIVIGPVAWLGFGLIGGVEMVVSRLDAELPSIPLPADSVKGWPLIGEQVYRLWTTAATDLKAILIDVAPKLKPLGGKLLDIAGNVGFGLLELIAAIIIAGFLFPPGPRLLDALRSFSRRILSDRGEELLQLAGNTIRNVSQGVVGVALVQSFLAGLGFLIAGVPAAGVLAFLALLLAIVQIGPAILLIPIVIWGWLTMETVHAVVFTVYMLVVGLIDNVLKPIVMARGVSTPMPVILIGVIGGTIAYGIGGLFLGPIVLSVAWALMVAWVQEDHAVARTAHPSDL
jgi:predicted PurR-regulated permease PerM